MSRKLLDIKHHLSSGCCMWSGIEDVYATRTGQTLPEAFLFALSSFGESVFLKFKDETRPFMFSVADGRTRKTYDKIKNIIGLNYQISEGRTLSYALTSIKREIDNGNPVILGPLDMFYLPYLKMYHKNHIPMHYILMVGYDDKKDCVLIYDCDREDLQELPKAELVQAWQIEKNAVGDKNGFIRFSLSEKTINKYELADICLRNKAMRQLSEKLTFAGINAYNKIAIEFPYWKDNFSEEEYRNALASLTEFLGMVPKLPNEILGIKEKEDICFDGNYNRLGNILLQLGEEYQRDDWTHAGNLFCQCGCLIEDITNRIIRFYCQNENCLSEIPSIFIKVGKYAERAYQIIADYKGGN
ncbi:BtrH N-terminal domain-containing protein [Clostridium oryzae]|uniref:Butirosin biosynthesis protein H N-terminal domain-containing protein n=1 Tax=Clostridium oryzae TaxID=1450648 RepID=A0A1V4IWB0_9CLOT|nr:BtrH N-terminal domain-containing protein [Clostridium oryzae]OPJ64236.1 hypothetical protein CLORY_08010 [Clostridium oryzae]